MDKEMCFNEDGPTMQKLQVVRSCLDHAASVAKTFVTSGIVVVEIKEPEAAAANPMDNSRKGPPPHIISYWVDKRTALGVNDENSGRFGAMIVETSHHVKYFLMERIS